MDTHIFPRESFEEEDELPVLGKGYYGTVVESRLGDVSVAVKLTTREYGEGLSHHLYVSPGSDCIVQPLGLRMDSRKKYLQLKEGVLFRDPDFADEKECFCLVMNRAKEVGKFTQKRPLEETRRLALHLLLAIEHLHRGGFLHGDIKTDNVLWFDEEEVLYPRLTDFDVATPLWPSRNRVQANALGRQFHSAVYRAPEHCLDKDFGLGLDVWAVGCVVFEATFGQAFVPCRQEQGMTYILGWLSQRFEETPLSPLLPPLKKEVYTLEDGSPLSAWYEGEGLDRGHIEVLRGMLNPSPEQRLSAQQLLDMEWFRPQRDFIQRQRLKSEEFWRRDRDVSLPEEMPFSLETVKTIFYPWTHLKGKDVFVLIKHLLYGTRFLHDHPEIVEEVYKRIEHQERLQHHVNPPPREQILLEVLISLCNAAYLLFPIDCELKPISLRIAKDLRCKKYPVLQKTTLADSLIRDYTREPTEKTSLEEIYEFTKTLLGKRSSLEIDGTPLFSKKT